MDLDHIDLATWVLILVIAVAFLLCAIGFLMNLADARQMAHHPANQRNHPSAILRNLVQALTQARLALGLGEAPEQNDPDFAALQQARTVARNGILNMPPPAPPGPPQPVAPAPGQGNNPPPAQGVPGTINIAITGDNLGMAVNGNQVFPPPTPRRRRS